VQAVTSSLCLPESRSASDSSIPPYEGIGLNEGDAAIKVGSQTAHMLTGLDLRKDHYFPLDVVLNEVTWMGTTASSADEWIERYNNTGSPLTPAAGRSVGLTVPRPYP
jgi:hypothetical protein